MPTATKTQLNLSAPVTTLPRVGPSVATKLARLGIQTLRDLILYWPRTWLDMSVVTPIKAVQTDQFALIQGTLHDITLERRTGSRAVRVQATVRDEAGSELAVLWFGQAYLATSLVEGRSYFLAGTVKWDWHRKRRYLASPTRETGLGVVAIYSETEGLTSRFLRGLIQPLLVDLNLPDPLPQQATPQISPGVSSDSPGVYLRLTQAVQSIHHPTTFAEAFRAKERLAYDEHLLLQLGLARQRQKQLTTPAFSIPPSIDAIKRLVTSLPFTLTDAQRRAAWDLIQHLQSVHQTHQLLQGDVGSGKTVVALLVALSVLESGYHVTWMVPTQLLARQLHERIGQLLTKTKHQAVLVMQGEESVETRQPTLFVGTHALLSRGPARAGDSSPVSTWPSQGGEVNSPSSSEVPPAFSTGRGRPVGLAIIDEQQRFGVVQREAARTSPHDRQPHVLTMTATPIPRSLALAILDEQSLVTLKGKPTHQLPIITKRARSRAEVIEHLKGSTQRGEQAFVVVPRIDKQSDRLFAQSIESVAASYRKGLPGVTLVVLHGQQSSDEQATILDQFSHGAIAILVATTVVEVGVDVPAATVMVIEEADRFGLAQLHQLRGRIGRGTGQGTCYLLSDVRDEQIEARLGALLETNDGFVLAQRDLELRGPGELLGTLQAGLPDLKLASLDDTLMVEQARQQAEEWLKDLPKQLEAWLTLYQQGTSR